MTRPSSRRSASTARSCSPTRTSVDTSLDYTGLQPITDTAPAVNYTFNDFGYPDQSFTANDGPQSAPSRPYGSSSTPTTGPPINFETTDIANKANVVFNTPAGFPVAGVGIIGTVDIDTPSTGLATLQFNTFTNANNNVQFIAHPARGRYVLERRLGQ